MEELVILDYNTCEVWLYTLPRFGMIESEIEDYIDSLGFRLSDISWMASGHSIKLNDERTN